MTKVCSQCGAKLSEKYSFCPVCGAIVAQKKKKFPYIVLVICFIIALLLAALLFFFRRAKQQVEIGDTIEFGTYEQDNDKSDGKEPIEWIVLDKEDDRVLLISKYSLDYKPYNTDSEEVTWEDSSLREWLNNDFIEEAFSSKEKKTIQTQTVENQGLYTGLDEDGSWIVTNSDEYVEEILYQTEGSNATEDEVYLLNADEAIRYLGSGIVEYPPLTQYAREMFIENVLELARENGYDDEETIREQYAEMEEEYGEGNCIWWLRSPGISGDTAAVVSNEADEIQIQGVSEMAAIRPVLWIKKN